MATIDRIDFGLLSPDEILRYSVCNVTHPETHESKMPKTQGLLDPRMGPSARGDICATCKQDLSSCPGHFGHIELTTPVCHVFYLAQIKKTLESICLTCGHLKIASPDVRRAIMRYSRAKERFRACWKVTKTKRACEMESCGIETPSIRIQNGVFYAGARRLGSQQILELFHKIPEQDLVTLGYSAAAHPAWMILTILPVPPPAVRPSMTLHNGTQCIDDLAAKLVEIVRVNNQIRDAKRTAASHSLNMLEESLMAHIATYFDNDCTSIPKSLLRQGRAIKSLKSRISGKTGRVRGSLMGKRVDFAARTVITGDPNIGVDEIGIPVEIAKTLTVPETVTAFNRDILQTAVFNGPHRHPGAVYVTSGAKKWYIRRNIVLELGDTVERHLRDGDYVLYNRQPTLSRYSMIAGRVRVLPGKTFRMHLSCTAPLNADFDGDEICVSVPQGIEASTELRLLCGVPELLVSPQSNKPTMAIIQDSLLGVMRLTRDETRVTRGQLCQLVVKLKHFDTASIPAGHSFTGKQVFSLLLPSSLNYRHGDVVIEAGQLVSGIICKKTIGTSGGSLVHLLWIDYGPERAMRFIDHVQLLVTEWLLMTGFSVGIGDCLIDAPTQAAISDVVSDINIRDMDEQRALLVLTQAREDSGKLAKENVTDLNGFVQMATAGSKGSMLNISQISGIVGQQCVEGSRIHGQSLPCFAADDTSPSANGFVSHSFVQGLTPAEYFFHAMGGREGLIHTAVKSVTGDTLVRVRGADRTCVVTKIGDWIDELLKQREAQKAHFPEDRNLEVVSVADLALEMESTTSTGQYKWCKVSFVTRHDPGDMLYRVVLRSGRFVVVTESESLLVLNPRTLQYEPRSVRDTMRGQMCPVYPGRGTKMLPERIVAIGQVKPHAGQKVYDVTVPETLNFVIANGIGVRDTASTGYINRRLVKAMEDLVVAYDGTVRTAEGLIVQTKYGHDGLDGSVIEKQPRPDYSKPLSRKADEVAALARDQAMLQRCFGDADLIQAPLHLPRIIASAVARVAGDPAVDLADVRKALADAQTDIPLFNALLRYYFSPVKIREFKLGKRALDAVVDTVKLRLRRGTVAPGEAVGAVAAQSIGEPTTQFALDSFHSSGVTNELVCTGVGRLTEILNDTKKTRTPSMRLYLHDSTCKDTAIRIASQLEHFSLSAAVVGLPDVLEASHESEWSRLFFDTYTKIVRPVPPLASHFLRIRLTEQFLARHVAKKIEECLEHHVLCAYNRDHVVHVYFIDAEKVDYHKFLTDHRVAILSCVSLSGCPEIERVSVRETTANEYYLETLGINLDFGARFPEVDMNRSVANNPAEIDQRIGIDAARECLVDEIRKVIDYGGSYVNIRHILLLADLMCVRGNIMPISRHGINRIQTGALRKATFEETLDVLTDAAVNGDSDNLRGISESVMVGKIMPAGTGYMDVLYNDAHF
jgi:DNA-directed RNA polymerase beta' subunit